jgi:hypothetical protein
MQLFIKANSGWDHPADKRSAGRTGSTGPGDHCLLGFLVRGVLSAKSAIFFELQPCRGFLLVPGRGIILTLALAARQMNDITHRLTPVPGPFQKDPSLLFPSEID